MTTGWVRTLSARAGELIHAPRLQARAVRTWTATAKRLLGAITVAILVTVWPAVKSSGGQTTLEVFRLERSRLGEEPPRRVDLLPDVPQQDASHAAAAQRVDDALA